MVPVKFANLYRGYECITWNIYHFIIISLASVDSHVFMTLKPQDSFGEFNNFFSWSSESVGNHQKTPSDLPAIVLNDIL